MNSYSRKALLILVLLIWYGGVVQAQPVPGTCEVGNAEAVLDANNVRAKLYNTGNLFWRGHGNVYAVPKWGRANAIFTAGLWIGGKVAGELRFAGAQYGRYHYWPGPLDNDGAPPADCAAFDHIYTISRADIEQYEQTGTATSDLRDWPWHLGAPIVDGDGNADNYDLAAGDRPRLYGDQTHWWVMNDAGNEKIEGGMPIGMEVQVTAYALQSFDALDNTTFYRYKLVYKGDAPLEDTYIGLWSDTDLGNAADDFIGSDTTRHMGFVYNADDLDEGFDAYGSDPPALGYLLLQGPVAPPDGKDNDRDGLTDEAEERYGMTSLGCHNKGRAPDSMISHYNCLQGRWVDGSPMTMGGLGAGTEGVPTPFAFPGHPPAYWSEENANGQGTSNVAADRRFVMGMGPFSMQPGEEQEIVFAIVWSSGLSRLHSVERLKEDADLVRAYFTGQGYSPAPAPAIPAASPSLIAPDDRASLAAPDPETFDPVGIPVFSWQFVGEALNYRVQVSTDPGFTSLLAEHRTLPDHTNMGVRQVGFSPQPDEAYYWRVRAENASGEGPWSEVRRFAVTSTPSPGRFALQANYPNPFSQRTTLVFDLPDFAEVRVEVFDVLGRRVLEQPAQMMTPGTARPLVLDASSLASGLYLYRVTANTVEQRWQEAGRMTVVR